jgi:hypothetical protein
VEINEVSHITMMPMTEFLNIPHEKVTGTVGSRINVFGWFNRLTHHAADTDSSHLKRTGGKGIAALCIMA